MRKTLCMLTALLLMLGCAGAEPAAPAPETAATAPETAEEREAGQLDLWYTDGEGRTWITAAIQAMDGMLLTSPALLPEKTDGLTVTDGQNEWEVKAVIPDSSGAMAFIFFNTEKNLPRRAAWPLMPFGDGVPAQTCRVVSGGADGGRTEYGVVSAASMEWLGCRCMLLQLDGEAPLGSAVLTAKGELAGMVAAEYAEGENRVLAMPAEEIVRAMTEAGSVLGSLVSWGEPPEGFLVRTEKNQATFDWSGMALPETAEGESLYLVVMDMDNRYLNFFPADTEERSLRMLLTPGRVYTSGILAAAGKPGEIPARYAVTVIPPAQKLTKYSFSPTLTAVAEMPPDAKEGQAPAPVSEVTEELLRSGRAYFYSASTYEVEEAIPDGTLLVTLTDPEGNNYRYESTWLYAPEYMKEDIWYISLTGTGLTWSLDQNGYPRGEYTLAYYVDGEIADTVTFDLK